jgi:hypothetical protein
MAMLAIAWPFILIARLITGDKSMPPRDRIGPWKK